MDNGLQFHPSKCKIPSFGFHDINFTLSDQLLPSIRQIDDLGIIVSNNLSWNKHIDSKISKCSEVFHFLKRNLPFSVSVSRKRLLYTSFVLPVLRYESCAWSPSITYMKKLESFQYKVLRWVCSCSSYKDGLNQLSLLPNCHQLIQADVLMLWKMVNGLADVNHEIIASSSATRLSSKGYFEVLKLNKFSSDNNFYVRAPQHANQLYRLKIVDFTMELPKCKKRLYNFLQSQTPAIMIRALLFELYMCCMSLVIFFCYPFLIFVLYICLPVFRN